MDKYFVLDTNVILHDYQCIYKFQENHLVIPITVIEEIDSFKKGHDQINFNAREFVRILDEICGEKLNPEGNPIGPGHGKIFITTNTQPNKKVAEMFFQNTADHRILSATIAFATQNPKRELILVSKDVNLRIKAKSLGLKAQDYYNDRIADIHKLYSGKRVIDNLKGETIVQLLTEGKIEKKDIVEEREEELSLFPNEFLILKNKKKSSIGVYYQEEDSILRVDKKNAYGIQARNAEQAFALEALLRDEIKLVTVSGKAGTGKTLLALAAAIESRKNYRQIFLARPIIPLSNRDIGFLPGDAEKKISPYMQPLFDNLGVIQNLYPNNSKEFKTINKMLETKKLIISPLAYIRGRSLENIFFIVDEAQNLTPHEVKTIITRAGKGCKIVLTGDHQQIDTPYLDSRTSGLAYLIDRMKGQEIYAHINLEKGERSKLADLASDLL